jgi:hypothetical protein
MNGETWGGTILVDSPVVREHECFALHPLLVEGNERGAMLLCLPH